MYASLDEAVVDDDSDERGVVVVVDDVEVVVSVVVCGGDVVAVLTMLLPVTTEKIELTDVDVSTRRDSSSGADGSDVVLIAGDDVVDCDSTLPNGVAPSS